MLKCLFPMKLRAHLGRRKDSVPLESLIFLSEYNIKRRNHENDDARKGPQRGEPNRKPITCSKSHLRLDFFENWYLGINRKFNAM